MNRIRLITLGLLLSASAASAGIESAGTTGATFLATGTGPAVLAMGGAGLGSGSGLNAAAWNPAALAWLRESHVALSHASLEESLNQEWISFGGRVGQGADRWGITALYQGEGGFAGRDASNQSTGGFGVSNSAFGANYARALGSNVAVGFGGKYVREDLAGVSGSGFGFDAGVQASAGPLGFGAAARNVGGKIRYANASYALPANVGVGMAWTDATRGLRLAVDANFPSAYYNDVRAGLEWRYEDRLALRGGYRLDLNASPEDRLGGPTFGFGTGANGLWLDYALLAGSAGAPVSHRIGLTLRPSQWMGMRAGLAANGTDAGAKDAPKLAHAATPASAPAKAEKSKPTTVADEPMTLLRPAPLAPPRIDQTPKVETPAKSARAPKPEQALVAAASQPPAARPWSVAVDASTLAEPTGARTRAPKSRELAASEPTAAVTPSELPTPPAEEAPREPSVKPVAEPSKPAESAKVPAAKRPEKVTVQSGQSLADIAKQWQTSVPALMMENNLVSEKVKPGKSLRLPPPLKP